MPINPFDEKAVFTCPRCGSHEFGPSGFPYTVACNGFVEGGKKCCQYTYLRKPDPPPKEAPTIRVGRWWRHRNSTTLVRVYRVEAWPSCLTGEPAHQEVWFETSDGTKRQDRLLDTLFLEFYRPHSQPGNTHESEVLPETIKTDSRDAATIAFDQIVEICGMKTWDYPGQVVRDVQILKDKLEALVKACGADRPEPICEGCGRRKATLLGFVHNFSTLLCDEPCGALYADAPKVRLEDYAK
jgi:hypothetical protein